MRFLVIVFFFPIFTYAQGLVDVNTFFSIGLTVEDSLDWGIKKKVFFPWIEEYEIRSETDEFELPRQEYTLRLSPSSPGKRKALKDAYQHLYSTPNFERLKASCEQVYAVHTDWLALYILKQKIDVLTEYQAVINDRLRIMEKLVGTDEVDLKKIVRLEIESNNLDIDIYKLGLEAKAITRQYGVDFTALNFQDFISIKRVEEALSRFSPADVALDSELSFKQETIGKELALERSENRQFLDFVQLKYRGPHTNLINERLSVGFGLRLPHSGDKKLKMKELEFEQKQLSDEISLKSDDVSQRLNELQNELKVGLEALAFYDSIAQKEKRRFAVIADLVTQKDGFDPLLLLDLKERDIQFRLDIIQISGRIYENYLKYLNSAGTMCAQGDVAIFLRN
ncbi:MAG: hypothetical protein AB8F95_05570 [Bacteroidia bacterium]